ncbi:MAG: single-stranded DNA-binding protein [Planctomycetaceae bacterium]|nr:single-stranded DNA-binding protein [Planctomycetaceae bacterium]
MASYNRVILVGNLTRDPELRYIPSGMAVTDIGLAVNDRRKNQNGEWVDDVTFIDITLWGRTAEVVCEFCGKGKPLFVEGRLKLDTWETDGQKKSKLKVIGERIQLLGTREGGGGGGDGGYRQSSAPRQQQSQGVGGYQGGHDAYDQPSPDDDVPF